MLSLIILNPGETPPGGWVFHDPKTDFVIKHNNLESLFNLALRHRQSNNATLEQEEFTQVVCKSTKRIQCSDGTPPPLRVQAQNFIQAVGQWVAGGAHKTPEAELANRRKICNACEHWGGERGGSLIKGRCRICGCRGIKLAMANMHCPLGKW